MKKTIIRILIFLSAFVLSVVIIMMLLNPLLRTHEGIRAYMLKATPIGMSMEDVVKVIEDSEKWRIVQVSEHGYSLNGGIPSIAHGKIGTIVGEKSMRVYLGEYRIIFITGVEVYYAFDEDLKLIDIAVSKDMDAM